MANTRDETIKTVTETHSSDESKQQGQYSADLPLIRGGFRLEEKVIEVEPLYRGDDRVPRVVFPEGFDARGKNTNLQTHVVPTGDSYYYSKDSAYISTTNCRVIASNFPAVPRGEVAYVYEIVSQRSSIDVAETFSTRFNKITASELERAFLYRIDGHEIKGAWPVKVSKFLLMDPLKLSSFGLTPEQINALGYKYIRHLQSDYIPNPHFVPPGQSGQKYWKAGNGLGLMLTSVGVGLDGLSIYEQYRLSEESGDFRNTKREVARVAGAWPAAWYTGTALAELAATACLPSPILTPVCAVTGGIIGSFIGYNGGSAFGIKIHDEESKRNHAPPEHALTISKSERGSPTLLDRLLFISPAEASSFAAHSNTDAKPTHQTVTISEKHEIKGDTKHAPHNEIKDTADQKHVHAIKDKLQKPALENGPVQNPVPEIDTIVDQMQDPSVLIASLTTEEKEQVKKHYLEQMKIEQLLRPMAEVVSDINAIFDRNAFARRFTNRDDQGLQSVLPELFFADKLAGLLWPTTTAKVRAAVYHSMDVMKGLTELGVTMSVTGLAKTFASGAYAGPAGMVVTGITGILGLLGGNDNQGDEVVIEMLQVISSQLAMLNENVVKGFQQVSIALCNLSAQVAEGLSKLESLSTKYHHEVMVILKHLERILYFDTALLEQIKQSVKRIEKGQIKQIIDRSDWKAAVSEVLSACEPNPPTLTLDDVKLHGRKLLQALHTVQENGLNRANEVNTADHAQVALTLDARSLHLGQGRGKKTLADNYRLSGEQHIHLLARLIGFEDWEGLVNPAAVTELVETYMVLIDTFQRSESYQGLTAEIKNNLNIFNGHLERMKGFLIALASSKELSKNWNEYVETLQQLTSEMAAYVEQDTKLAFGDKFVVPTRARLESEAKSQAALSAENTHNFFTLPPNSFNFRWEHWWEVYDHNGPPHWSHDGSDYGSTKYGRAPTWSIEPMRNAYYAVHHERAKKIHADFVQSLWSKPAKLDEQHQSPYQVLFQPMFDVNQTYAYGFNFVGQDNIMFPVSEWHLKQIPKGVYVNLMLGLGQLQFTWQHLSNDAVMLRASWHSTDHGYRNDFTLFEQVTSMPGLNVYLNKREALFYTVYGGDVPTGLVIPWDDVLNRQSDWRDRAALNQYNTLVTQKDVDWRLHHYPNRFRKIIGKPVTNYQQGMYTTSQYPLTDNIALLNTWRLIKLNETQAQALNLEAENNLRQFRKDRFTALAQHVTTKSKLFNKLDAQAKLLRSQLLLTIDTAKLEGIDPAFPNIFDGDDVVRVLTEYSGLSVTPLNQLQLNARALSEMRERVLQHAGHEHYPFLKMMGKIEGYSEDVATKIVPNRVANSKCDDEESCERFIEKGLPRLPQVVQRQWVTNNLDYLSFLGIQSPLLTEGDSNTIPEQPVLATQTSSWPLPGAYAASTASGESWSLPSYQSNLDSQLILLRWVSHWVGHWFSASDHSIDRRSALKSGSGVASVGMFGSRTTAPCMTGNESNQTISPIALPF